MYTSVAEYQELLEISKEDMSVFLEEPGEINGETFLVINIRKWYVINALKLEVSISML